MLRASIFKEFLPSLSSLDQITPDQLIEGDLIYTMQPSENYFSPAIFFSFDPLGSMKYDPRVYCLKVESGSLDFSTPSTDEFFRDLEYGTDIFVRRFNPCCMKFSCERFSKDVQQVNSLPKVTLDDLESAALFLLLGDVDATTQHSYCTMMNDNDTDPSVEGLRYHLEDDKCQVMIM